jgi:hypothetical protein
MENTGKRTVQVNVKMSAEDFSMLQRAAGTLWPEALSAIQVLFWALPRLQPKMFSRGHPPSRDENLSHDALNCTVISKLARAA